MAVTVDRVQPSSFLHLRLMETGFATMVFSNMEIKWKCVPKVEGGAKLERIKLLRGNPVVVSSRSSKTCT